jgi:hypothetical protein
VSTNPSPSFESRPAAKFQRLHYVNMAAALTLDGYGNVYVTATTSDSAEKDSGGYATIKYDTEGHQI